MGKIIDAEFGGRNADDRYCAACEERYPRRSSLCPRCGGALTIWATHSALRQRRQRRARALGWGATSVLGVLVLILVAIALQLFQ